MMWKAITQNAFHKMIDLKQLDMLFIEPLYSNINHFGIENKGSFAKLRKMDC